MEEVNIVKKIVDYSLIFLSFVIAVIFFFSFDLENILWNRREDVAIKKEQIEEKRAVNYIGSNPGDNILSLKTKEEWDKALNEVDYVTVVPKSIIKTDVYSLAKWVNPYTKRSNGTSGRRLDEVKQTSFDISASYSPYYIIQLDDGTNILAQMNRGIANSIKKRRRSETSSWKKDRNFKAGKEYA